MAFIFLVPMVTYLTPCILVTIDVALIRRYLWIACQWTGSRLIVISKHIYMGPWIFLGDHQTEIFCFGFHSHHILLLEFRRGGIVSSVIAVATLARRLLARRAGLRAIIVSESEHCCRHGCWLFSHLLGTARAERYAEGSPK
jgi:hypothetical protein